MSIKSKIENHLENQVWIDYILLNNIIFTFFVCLYDISLD